MSNGKAYRFRFDDLEAFAACIGNLNPSEAIALGALRDDLPGTVEITTKDRLTATAGSVRPGLIARTGDHISYRPGTPALALIDIDTKAMPASVRSKIDAAGGFWSALVFVLPELARAGRVLRRSTSSGIFRGDTDEQLPGSNGLHVFVLVKDGADIERFLRTLHARCWLHGFGWLMVGAGGQLLERSLVDRMVYAPERLVFESAPILEAPMAQDHASRAPVVTEGRPLDTRAVCLDLSVVELARLRDLQVTERARLAPDAERVRAAFVEQQAERIAARTGCSAAAARLMVERQCGGVLLPGLVLPFDAAEVEGTTVADVLADPGRFVGATLADPLEGPNYGRTKAKIMRRSDGTLWINSFAHGRTTYELRHDASSVEAALRAGDPREAADRLVRMLLAAHVAPDEEQRLCDLARELSGVKPRPLTAKLKAARQQQQRQREQAERKRQAAAPRDRRLRLPAPEPDGERLPVLRALDEILCGVGDAEPPMRDIDGHPVEVRCRPSLALHELSAEGSNQADAEKSRLPPPALPLLTQHNKHTLVHEIERYVEFTRETDSGIRAVALPPVFIEHYLEYRDSALPRVGAVVTAPLVLPDGMLLAPKCPSERFPSLLNRLSFGPKMS
jgi:hypothetical protein